MADDAPPSSSGRQPPAPLRAGPVCPRAAARHFLSRLDRPMTLLIALSGGSDSTALLHAFHTVIAETPHRLAACTVDHALRPGSRSEAEAVARLCTHLGVPHAIRSWAHQGLRSGLQARARLARYRLLAEAAAEVQASLVLTGHTADDQAETVAMRSARLSPEHDGLSPGLAGMDEAVLFDRRIWIARPFLGLSRVALRRFLAERQLSWIEDPSNENAAFERVRIRQSQAPLMAPTMAGEQRKAGASRIARMIDSRVTLHTPCLAEVALSDGDLTDPDMRRLLALLAAILGGRPHAMGRETADRLFSALTQRQARFAAGRTLFDRRGARLYLHREARDLPELVVSPGHSAVWDGRFRITNRGNDDLLIRATGHPCETDGRAFAPPAILRRAAAVAPALGPPASVDLGDAVVVTPWLAPFDTFLPRFDSKIAAAFARLFRREPFPACPVHDDPA